MRCSVRRILLPASLLGLFGCEPALLTTTTHARSDARVAPADDAGLASGADRGATAPSSLYAPGELLGLFVDDGYRLSWTDTNTAEEHYVVERAPSRNAEFRDLAELGAGTLSYTDRELASAGAGKPVYRVRAVAGGARGPAAECDAAVKAWTFIRIAAFDALWGSKGPTMESVKEQTLAYSLETVSDRRNFNLVLFGDSYGSQEGGIYASVGESGTVVQPRPEPNTGAPETYRQLFDWVVANYPGQRYALSFFSHGSGLSLAFDETSQDALTTRELATVLDHLAARAGRKIEVFFMCACFQQMVENAFALGNSVRYVVAGESSVGCGCDLLDKLKSNPDKDAAWLAEQTTACQAMPTYKKDVVFSSIRTDKAAPLGSALDQLGSLLKGYAERGASEAAKLKALAATVQNLDNANGTQWAAHLDLVDLCEQLGHLGDPSIAQQAKVVLQAAKEAITSVVIQNDAKGLYGRARGLAIYHPNPHYPYYFSVYDDQPLSSETRWDDYLRTLYP